MLGDMPVVWAISLPSCLSAFPIPKAILLKPIPKALKTGRAAKKPPWNMASIFASCFK